MVEEFPSSNCGKRAVLEPSRTLRVSNRAWGRTAGFLRTSSSLLAVCLYPSSLVKGTGRQPSSLARKEWASRVDTTVGDCGKMLNSDPKKSSPLPQGRRCRGKCQVRSQQCQAGGNHGEQGILGKATCVVKGPHRRACLKGTLESQKQKRPDGAKQGKRESVAFNSCRDQKVPSWDQERLPLPVSKPTLMWMVPTAAICVSGCQLHPLSLDCGTCQPGTPG